MAENEKYKKIREDATVTINLPEDIIFDLLFKLPVKSLLRFRCVSKSWCALIDHPDFAKIHLTRSIATMNNRSIVSVLRYNRKETVMIVSVDLDDCEEGEAEAGVFDTPFPIPVLGYVLVSCNGLIYMFDRLDCTGFGADLPSFLVNPSTRRHRKMPYSLPDLPINSNTAYLTGYGFGYDSTTEDYTVIRVFVFTDYGEDYEDYVGFGVIVYSLISHSWRRIENIPLFRGQHEVGVFTNSAFHWVPKTTVSTSSTAILSIDIKDDEYRELPLPDVIENYRTMTLGVLGEKLQLCIFCDSFTPPHVELWVMKDYGVRNSWEKQFLIQDKLVLGYFNNYVIPICYSRKGEVLFETSGKNDGDSVALVLYDPHKVRASILRRQDKWNNTICIESLISLDMKDGADKEKKRR